MQLRSLRPVSALVLAASVAAGVPACSTQKGSPREEARDVPSTVARAPQPNPVPPLDDPPTAAERAKAEKLRRRSSVTTTTALPTLVSDRLQDEMLTADELGVTAALDDPLAVGTALDGLVAGAGSQGEQMRKVAQDAVRGGWVRDGYLADGGQLSLRVALVHTPEQARAVYQLLDRPTVALLLGVVPAEVPDGMQAWSATVETPDGPVPAAVVQFTEGATVAELSLQGPGVTVERAAALAAAQRNKLAKS